MGYAERLNPLSAEGGKPTVQVQRARLSLFLDHFPNRAAYEQYLASADVTDPRELDALEGLLPPRLQTPVSA